ncbi:myeloid-associated differentiation marker-like protein 2-like [Arapaima gigas]
MCCGVFCEVQHMLRLIEIILSGVSFSLATYFGALIHPYGWDDFTCGMTMLCSLMMLSASFMYTFQYACQTCIIAIACAVFSFAGVTVYVVHAVMAKLKCPSGFLSNMPGFLRVMEAFVANIILSSVASYFLDVGPEYRPPGMIWCSLIYSVCLPVTVVIILLKMIKFFNMVCCALDKFELIFNVVSVIMYLSASIVWSLYGYYYYKHSHKVSWGQYHLVKVTTVTVMTIINLILYTVDLAYSIIAVNNRI